MAIKRSIRVSVDVQVVFTSHHSPRSRNLSQALRSSNNLTPAKSKKTVLLVAVMSHDAYLHVRIVSSEQEAVALGD